jgi:hypothetical protein
VGGRLYGRPVDAPRTNGLLVLAVAIPMFIMGWRGAHRPNESSYWRTQFRAWLVFGAGLSVFGVVILIIGK